MDITSNKVTPQYDNICGDIMGTILYEQTELYSILQFQASPIVAVKLTDAIFHNEANIKDGNFISIFTQFRLVLLQLERQLIYISIKTWIQQNLFLNSNSKQFWVIHNWLQFCNLLFNKILN